MSHRTSLSLSVVLTTAACLLAVAGSAPAAGVSPGAADHVAVVGQRCPTFSWQDEAGAVHYELVAYALPEHLDDGAVLTADLREAVEVLYTTVPGGASGWTPSTAQCLTPGGRYVWFVRAVYGMADGEVVDADEWSPGRFFAIPAAPSDDEMRRALEVIRRWEAGGGAPQSSVIRSSGTGTGTGTGTTKSVPTASAAIRGEHPSLTGEAYGIIGTSAADGGAGVAAAHLDGGPDLVLDGSVDGEADTVVYEWGLDRPSANHETFIFGNSGQGHLAVQVRGELAADTLNAEEIYMPTGLVIDEESNWRGVGDTIPCAGCVRSADIVDGSITDNDLSDDAVTEAKIEGGAVSTSRLANNAVTSAKIFNGTITSADLADGAVTGRKIAAGTVTSLNILDGTIGLNDLAINSVDSSHIVAGSIMYSDLYVGSVRTEQILDGAVQNADLGNDAVTSAKIADGAVTSANIADGTIEGADISPSASLNADTLDGLDSSAFQRVLVFTSDNADWAQGGEYIDTCTAVFEMDVTIPGPGTVFLDGRVTASIDHTSGVKDRLYLFIEPFPGDCSWGDMDSATFLTLPAALPTGSTRYNLPVPLSRTYHVGEAGTHTFYINAYMYEGGAFETDAIQFPNLRAVFYPD